MSAARQGLASLAILFGLLPPLAGASPLLIRIDPEARHLDEAALRTVVDCLAKLGASLARDDSLAFCARFDATRAQLLLGRATDSARGLDYGPVSAALSVWRRPASAHEALRCALAGEAQALAASEPDARCLAVIRTDARLAERLWPRGQLPALHIRHGHRYDSHPLLGETLLVSWLTDLSWSDDRCDSWRHERRAASGACPLLPGVLTLDPPRWATAAERSAWLDSLFQSEPALARAGWLKRRLLRGALARMAEVLEVYEGARERLREQTVDTDAIARTKREGLAGPAPPAPDAKRAVLRLLFLRDSRERGLWRLSLAWLSPLQLDSLGEAYLEPGFMPWAERYARWRERGLARIEAATKG